MNGVYCVLSKNGHFRLNIEQSKKFKNVQNNEMNTVEYNRIKLWKCKYKTNKPNFRTYTARMNIFYFLYLGGTYMDSSVIHRYLLDQFKDLEFSDSSCLEGGGGLLGNVCWSISQLGYSRRTVAHCSI